MKKFARRRSSAFTLLEILVVISIIALLAAILFPAFKSAQERGRQSNCATNLNQIYFAVQQYFQDERAYPDSLTDLLPEGAKFDDGSPAGTGVIDANAVGYLKSGNSLLTCQNDDTDSPLPRSSYGALSKFISGPFDPNSTTNPRFTDPANYVWNYWGYDEKGFAYLSPQDAADNVSVGSILLVSPKNYLGVDQGYAHESLGGEAADDFRKENVLRYSLSNRFADPSTIITHCVFHRLQTADNLNNPYELYTDTANSKNARDIVLRLDGSARALDVTTWWKTGDVTADLWQNQIVPN